MLQGVPFGRGKAAVRWLEKLQGKKMMQVVKQTWTTLPPVQYLRLLRILGVNVKVTTPSCPWPRITSEGLQEMLNRLASSLDGPYA